MPLLTRRKFVRPKDIAEQYSISIEQVYKLINLPMFKEAVFRVGRAITIDQDMFYEINRQYFNS